MATTGMKSEEELKELLNCATTSA